VATAACQGGDIKQEDHKIHADKSTGIPRVRAADEISRLAEEMLWR